MKTQYLEKCLDTKWTLARIAITPGKTVSRFLASAFLFAGLVSADSIGLVAGTAQPLIQMTGEHFQIYSSGVYFVDFVPGRTLSQAGVGGADLGAPVVYPDKIVFFFGDSLPIYEAPGPRYYLDLVADGDDSIGFIPNMDLSQCRYIPEVDLQIMRGNPRPVVSPANCPAIQFYKNPAAGPTSHRFMKTTIAGLLEDETTGPYRVPTGAVDVNGSLYMFYVTQQQPANPYFALRSALLKADQPNTAWSDSTPPTFTRLYTASSHPPVANPNNPPLDTNDYGKFVFSVPVAIDTATLAECCLSHFPPELQAAGKIVLNFGSSWRYNRSNLYLAAFAAADIEAGPAKWHYYTGHVNGVATWSNDEKAAAPMIPNFAAVGDHSVVWNAALKRFVFMYGNIATRFSPTPWGPWSDPILVINNQSDWAAKLVHHVGQDPIVRTVQPVFNPRNERPVDFNPSEPGIPYGPMLIDKYTQNADGSVTIYYLMSTWNPYQTWLMSSTFVVGNTEVPTSRRTMPQIAFGGGWYTGLYFHNSNDVPVTVEVKLYDAVGQPLVLPVAGQTGATLGLLPKGTGLVEFPNRGGIRQGWADVILPNGVTGYGVFRQTVAGRFDQEAVVPLLTADSAQAGLVFDDTVFTTTLAYVNPSQAQNSVNLVAKDENGTDIGTTTVALLPNGRQAVSLRAVVPGVAGKRGSIRAQANPGTLSLMGLRFNNSAFTTIPGTGSPGVNITVAMPQVAFGSGWYSALNFANSTDAAVQVELAFFDSNGQPLFVPSLGGATKTIAIAPHGTAIVEMPNTGTLQQGWARAVLPDGVSGYGVFRQSAQNRPDQEAVVPFASTTSALSTVIFDDTAFTTSVALANPTSGTIQVNVTARNEAGAEIGAAQVELPGNGTKPIVLRELIPAIAGVRGSVRFDAGLGAVAVLGLRFNTAAFTSIPAETN